MRGIVDQDVLDDFKHRLRANSQVEIYNDRNLVEALYGKTLNPYPMCAILNVLIYAPCICCREV